MNTQEENIWVEKFFLKIEIEKKLNLKIKKDKEL